ncbi:hypothetical protein F3J34_24645 [Klebsiella sp. Ap-873]|nr:hypothetical protein [Klebsiella sp. Ap-873]
MELPKNGRAEWLAAGWKRGAFIRLEDNHNLRQELPQKLLTCIENKSQVYVVPVIYDCALIEENFEKEPWAQVLVIWESSFDGNFAYAKNPRKMHLKAKRDGHEICFEITALSFAQIDREILLQVYPDQSVTWRDGDLALLLDWVAERYRQATFPDSFNNRLVPSRKLLDRLWKSDLFCQYSSGVYINLNTSDELEDEHCYQIKIMISIPFHINGREYREIDRKYSAEMVQKVKSIFDAVKNLKVISVETISEREFTKELERGFNRFSLEHFSYKSGAEDNPLPAEYLGG